MKRTNKKGFTLVELVIVIAIIAILAAVLIPTFAGVVRKANESAALQSARNAYTECMTLTDATLSKISEQVNANDAKATSANLTDDEKLKNDIIDALKEVGVTSVVYSDNAFKVVVNANYTFTYTTANGWQKVNN